MKDALAVAIAKAGDDPRLKRIVDDVCRVTGMGFAAIACVTRDRWIACQVADRIEFGLDPGQELEIKTTICNDIRDCGDAVVIDDLVADERWRRHHAPILYGFKSYASFPLFLDDGRFFGTLCAIDPEPCRLSADATIAFFEARAHEVAAILSAAMAGEETVRSVLADNPLSARGEPAH